MNPVTEIKFFTKEEVAKHNQENDCWLIINNDVCKVTDFLASHPGGLGVLMMNAGKDCTQFFEDIGHSKDAKDLVKKYKIGELKQ